MKNRLLSALMFFGIVSLIACESKKSDPAAVSETTTGPDRTSLPIKEPLRPTYKELDVRNATPPKRFEVKAPEGAPTLS